jgi:hypothetical protein
MREKIMNKNQSVFNSESRVSELFSGLLASENITVNHEPEARTACFDPKARALTLPTWLNMSDELYCMMIGHEVGHALFTPADFFDNLDKEDPKLGTFLTCVNLVEDVRVDKLIQTKYPGLKSDYRGGMKELYDRDFFGFEKKPIEKQGLLNKMNAHFKLRYSVDEVDIEFSEDEVKLIERIDNCVSFENVLKVAKELVKLVKFDKEKKAAQKKSEKSKKVSSEKENAEEASEEKNASEESGSDEENNDNGEEKKSSEEKTDSESEETDGHGEESGSSDEESESDESESGNSNEETEESDFEEESESSSKSSDDSEEESEEDDFEESDSEEKEENENNKSENKTESEAESTTTEESKSATEESEEEEEDLQSKLEKEIQKSFLPKSYEADTSRCKSKTLEYYDFPTRDVTKIIKSNDELFEEISELAKEKNYDLKEFSNKLKNKNKCVVDYLVKEFELRKNAKVNARSKVSKTGVLDYNKLHQYKYNNDLFLRNVSSDRGKNHGVVMLIDMSGSMYYKMSATIEQTLNVVMFCKKVNIPFEVFGFTGPHCGHHYESVDGFDAIGNSTEMLISNRLKIINLFSSKMTTREFNNAVDSMSILYDNFHKQGRVYISPRNFRLDQTPLCQSLAVMKQVIKKFKLSNELDIVNFMLISDGQENIGLYTSKKLRDKQDRKENYYAIPIVRDKVANRACRSEGKNYEDIVSAMLKLIKEDSNCKVICFYLLPPTNRKSDISWTIENQYRMRDQNLDEKTLENFWTDGVAEFSTESYDSFLLIETKKNFAFNDFETEVKDMNYKTASAIRRNFSKALNNQLSCRILLKKLIDVIA